MAQRKSKRTLDDYMKAGAEARLLKIIFSKFLVDCGNLMYASDGEKLRTVARSIDIIVSRAEDYMFQDFPTLGHNYVNVFYGCFKDTPINDVDAEIQKIAEDTIKQLMEKSV